MTHPGTQPYFSRGARFASYSGPYRTQIGPPHLARITRPGPSALTGKLVHPRWFSARGYRCWSGARAYAHLSLEQVEELFILHAPKRFCAKPPHPPPLSPLGGRGVMPIHLDGLWRRLCLRTGHTRWWARKMGRQEARFARRRSRFHPLTPHLAQEESRYGFKASRAWLEPLQSERLSAACTKP